MNPQIFLTGAMILLVLDGYHGMGRHTDTVSAAESVIQKKVEYLLSVFLNTCLASLKTSIALALISLCGVHIWLKNSLWALIGKSLLENCIFDWKTIHDTNLKFQPLFGRIALLPLSQSQSCAHRQSASGIPT